MDVRTNAKFINKCAKNVFRNFAQCVRLFLSIPYIDNAELSSRCDYTEIDNVLEHLEKGKGAVFVSAHIGPWDLGGALMLARGVRLHTVTLDHPSRRVTGYFNERRKKANLSVYSLEDSFQKLQNALENGEHVGLLIDREYGKIHRTYDYFGIPTALPNSHLLLAAKTGAPIVFLSILCAPGDRFKTICKGPYHIGRGKHRQKSMDEVQRCCLKDIETVIKTYPNQYFHFLPLAARSE